MNYCISCLIPDTRPNGFFNQDGKCQACVFVAEQKFVDFEQRVAQLEERIASLVRHRRRHRWHCIVGVSGGKDSHRQALWVRDKLGLHPLLVSIGYPSRQQAALGPKNLGNLIDLGFDCLSIAPGPKTSRRLVREGFLRFGNWQKATEMALFAGVQQTAIAESVDLILWGENPALQVGDSGAAGPNLWDGRNLRNLNTLGGGDIEWFDEVIDDRRKMALYRLPSHAEIDLHGVKTLFLGPAWSDWSFANNTAVALLHGFQTRSVPSSETGDLYFSSQIDEDWTVVNGMIKWFKFGFGQGTEQANALIRSGKISRDDGRDIAIQLDGQCDDRYVSSFSEYVGMSVPEFWNEVFKWVNRDIFEVPAYGRPRPLFTPGQNLTGGR